MFTQEQLELIKEAAKKSKNQGEMAVYKFLHFQYFLDIHPPSFTENQWDIIKYCAEECERQHSKEMSVYDMCNAWKYASIRGIDYGDPINKDKLDLKFIEAIGKLVEPDDNRNGFRTIPIGVTDGMGGWIEKAPFDRIQPLLTHLIFAYYDPDHPLESMIRADEGPYSVANTAEDVFYYEYENIHPFRDGNGRSGKILYNYLNGTLNDPIMPPNFWNSSNP